MTSIFKLPRVGAQTLPGTPTYDFAKFYQKMHEIERIWVGGGGEAHPKFYIGKITKVRRINNKIVSLIHTKSLKKNILAGFVPLARLLYILQPPDVSTWRDPQVNTFEQVSSLGHHISLAGRGALYWGTPTLWTDTHTQLKTLPSHTFFGWRK